MKNKVQTVKNSLEVTNSSIKQTEMTSVNGYRGDECQNYAYVETKSSESKRTSRLVRNTKMTRGPRESETPRRERDEQGEDRDQERFGEVMLCSEAHPHEGKSMLKHIMKKCKVVNYVGKETSSATPISSRRRFCHNCDSDISV